MKHNFSIWDYLNFFTTYYALYFYGMGPKCVCIYIYIFFKERHLFQQKKKKKDIWLLGLVKLKDEEWWGGGVRVATGQQRRRVLNWRKQCVAMDCSWCHLISGTPSPRHFSVHSVLEIQIQNQWWSVFLNTSGPLTHSMSAFTAITLPTTSRISAGSGVTNAAFVWRWGESCERVPKYVQRWEEEEEEGGQLCGQGV